MVGTLTALWRRGRTLRSSGIDPRRIDAFTVGEPWRRHVSAAQSAQRRFGQLVAATERGPLRDRLEGVGQQVQRGVEEIFEIAQRGDRLDDTIRTLDGHSLRAQRERATDDGVRSSLDTQLLSLQRIRDQRDAADVRLRQLHTRLGEMVSQAAEVTTGIDSTEDLGSAVDEVVQQLEALRLAVEDVTSTSASSATIPPAAPGPTVAPGSVTAPGTTTEPAPATAQHLLPDAQPGGQAAPSA
jgi:hypothetical protein